MSIQRRDFLRGGAAAAALALSPRTTWARPLGANDDIRVAVVGVRSRGRDALKGYLRQKGVRVVAICDADQKYLDKEKARFAERKQTVETWVDYREMLEKSDIDAVSIATPNHWHALQAIWACQAGKDVYVEKPVSHNVWEGRQIVEAARRYGRIVQTGTQCRSSGVIADTVREVQEGQYGKVLWAKALCYKRRKSIGNEGKGKIPKTLNYDLWLGPAPKKELARRRLHYDWHWVWDTGNGDLGNQGIHQMDIARWFLGERGFAPRTWSLGGRLGYEDDGETPNTFSIVHDYEQAPLVFEVRGLPQKSGSDAMDRMRGVGIGVIVACEGATIINPSYSSLSIVDKDGKTIAEREGSSDHYVNFIEALRSRDPGHLKADIEEGHVSSALCHLGNISYACGAEQELGELRDRVSPDPLRAGLVSRMQEHLAANGVTGDGTKLRVGANLLIDPSREDIVNSERARKLLRRDGRDAYRIPERV